MGSKWLDTPAARLLGFLGDLLVANLLCLVCAAPVVTIGAAVSAMYAVLFQRERTGSVAVVRTIFAAFKEGFGKAFLLGLIALAVSAAAAGDILFALTSGGAAGRVYMIVGMVMAGIALILLTMPLAQQAVFQNTVGGLLKNSFLLSFAAPGQTLLIWAAWVIPYGLMILLPDVFLVRFGVVYLLWGMAGPAWVTVRVLEKVFQRVQGGG